MRRTLLLCCLLAASAAAPLWAVEQTITPLTNDVGQDVRPIGGDDGQTVRAVDPGAEQSIDTPEPPGPVAKAASTAGKVVLGVAGGALALGFMVASLLFF